MGHDTRQDDFKRTRAFLYGESAFTTMRVSRGRIFFAEAHRDRLLQSAEWLWPGTASQAESLWRSLEPPGDEGVWRITLTAQASGRGLRSDEAPQLLMDDWWTPGLPNDQSWKARLVSAAARPPQWPAFLKAGDYLSRLVSARRIATDEIPLFHVGDKICEFLHANVLFWDGEAFHTPLAGADVLAGLGRARFMEVANRLGMLVHEREIRLSEVAHFKTIMAVNAVRGLVPVAEIDGRAVGGHPLGESLKRSFFV